jgi:hypothetical protein
MGGALYSHSRYYEALETHKKQMEIEHQTAYK